ncbi:MAG: methyltransferase domain-containing protein, partial [Firmicutes bacterium]|nr:methyltransferase domain-containing protein [Bacillota bacterium]
MPDWNSTQYLKFKKERTQPSIDLAARIDLENPVDIIDIGCGPGNSTAVLKTRFPKAKILGVDSSRNMVDRAKADNPDLSFKLLDVTSEDWRLGQHFDIAFSNACIQWVPDHKALLPKIMGILKEGGKMAVQIPFNFKQPIHTLTDELIKTEKWCKKINEPRIFYTLTAEEYYDILAEISSDFQMWETVYCHRMKSCEDIIEWYKSTGLKPYLDTLNDDDKREFLADVLVKVREHYPLRKNGEVIFR